MGNGQWAINNGQWAMGSGQWAMKITEPKFCKIAKNYLLHLNKQIQKSMQMCKKSFTCLKEVIPNNDVKKVHKYANNYLLGSAVVQYVDALPLL